MTDEFRWQKGRLRIDEATAGELHRMLVDESIRLTGVYKDTELDDSLRQQAFYARRRVRRLLRELGRTMTEKGWWADATDVPSQTETEEIRATDDEHGNPEYRGISAQTTHPHLSRNVLEPTP